MHKDCKQVKDIVNLWYETQMGNMHKCKEKQFEFAEIMWGLYDNKTKKKEKQTMGRAIDQDNRLDDHERSIRAEGVELEPDEVYTAPVGKRKRTTRKKTATVD